MKKDNEIKGEAGWSERGTRWASSCLFCVLAKSQLINSHNC